MGQRSRYIHLQRPHPHEIQHGLLCIHHWTDRYSQYPTYPLLLLALMFLCYELHLVNFVVQFIDLFLV